MSESWYPRTIRVGPFGVPKTYQFMQTVFAPDQAFTYAEFGIYRSDTAHNVCTRFPKATLHLFDFHERIDEARARLSVCGNDIHYYGNTQKYNDSYNWSLMKIIEAQKGQPLFDYCFLDGAHTVAVDALNYFLCDILLKVGGYIDFDDYDWRLRGSSLSPEKVPAIAQQYTDEQINAYQVKMIVDTLVRRSAKYVEVNRNKVFQKIAE